MKKNLKLVFSLAVLCFSFLKTEAQNNCNNVDFETGTFANWTGYTGFCCPINTPTPGIINGRQTIMTGAGFDPNIPSIPVVSPNGGVYSVRLGNDNSGAEAEKLRYQFTVSAANSNFMYEYAVILDDYGHLPPDQPRFDIDVRDQFGNIIPCGSYHVVAGGSIPGFQSLYNSTFLDTLRYKNWSSVSIDLSAYISQTVTVEFATGDCAQGAHFGYAYIDCACNPLSVQTAFCPGSSQAVLVAPSGYQSYAWSNGDTTQVITIQNPVAGTSYTVTMTPYQSTSCTSVLTFNLTISPAFTAHFNVNTSCGAGSVQFSDSSFANAGGFLPSGWIWNFGDGTTDTVQNPIHVYNTPGTYTITMIAIGPGGCNDTTSQTINIPAGISPSAQITSNFNGAAISCFGMSDGAAVCNVSGGTQPYSYSWNTSPIQSTANASGLAAGTYTCTVTDAAGCITFATVTLVQPNQLNGNITSTPITCIGTDGSLTANVNGGTNPYSYSWNCIPVQTTATASNLSNGTYTCTVTDANNCSLQLSDSVTGINVMHLNPDSVPVSCFGLSDGVASVIASGGIQPYGYTWFNNTTLSSVSNLSAGTYSVTVSNNNGCPPVTISVIVTQPDSLIVSVGTTPANCVSANNGVVFALVNGGTYPYAYVWNTPSNQNDSAVYNLISGWYTLTLTDAHGCTATAADSVLFLPDFTVDAGADAVIHSGDIVQLNAVPSRPGNFNYVWMPSTALSNPNIKNPTAQPVVPTTYTVVCTEDVGCTATDSLFINIIPFVYLPNAFTPNGDGLNDDFFPIPGDDKIVFTSFNIYDRWGKIIYTTSENKPWDGKSKGKECEIGTYVYLLEFDNIDGKHYALKGNVTLLR